VRKATHKNKPLDYDRARHLRVNTTDYEQKLWQQLRSAPKMLGIKFRRQQPIHPYIVDFVCFKAKLIIEVDGYSHDVNVEHDIRRSIYLEKLDYKILRFSNDEISKNLQGVVSTILSEANRLLNLAK
jgi:very-short-patch-repair endonuclease